MRINNLIKKVFISLLLLSFATFSSFAPTFANENLATNESNTNSPVGPIEEIGPKDATGPKEPTGPQQSAANNVTGAESANQKSDLETTEQKLETTNNSSISNDADLESSTGNNDLTKNSSVESFSSGNIENTLNFINTTNSVLDPGSSVGAQSIDGSKQSEVILTPSNNRTPLSAINSLTGPDSLNLNQGNQNSLFAIIDNTNSQIKNDININADTGHNNFY